MSLGGAKARALLAFLLLSRGEAVTRERLVGELWGEQPPKAVAAELRVYVAKLRKALGPERRRHPSSGLRVRVAHPESVDAGASSAKCGAERTFGGGRRANGGTGALATRSHSGGDPCSRIVSGEPWAAPGGEPPRGAADNRRSRSGWRPIWSWAGTSLVISELERLVDEQPYRERPRSQLMLALYRCGRQADALALYRMTARVLLARSSALHRGPSSARASGRS